METEDQKAFLLTLAKAKMPFGKYQGHYLIDRLTRILRGMV